MDYLLLFIVGLVAFFAANISGAGASLIILPVLIGLGLSPIDSVGTLSLGAVGFIIGSLLSRRARGIVRRDHIVPLVLIAAVASVIGPFISLNLSQDAVKKTSAFLIILTAIFTLLTWKTASESRQVSSLSRYSGYFFYFFSTTLLAGFGAGIGLISSYILVGLVGMSALETIATRRIVGIVAVSIQLSIYASHGHVNMAYGMTLALSGLIGAYFGINYAVKKGNDFVKKAMAVTAIVLVILLFV